MGFQESSLNNVVLVASEVTIEDLINTLFCFSERCGRWFLKYMNGIVVNKVRPTFAKVLGEVK